MGHADAPENASRLREAVDRSGERHDRPGLKAREAKSDRPVPIPPVLVAILRAHLDTFGTAK